MLVAAAVLLFTVGKAYFSLPGVWEAENQRVRELRLDPLGTFRTGRVWWGPWLNLAGNVALFAPVGFAAYRGSIARATLAGALASVAIEAAQYVLAAGYTDVEDLAFNTLGAFLGACLAARVRSSRTLRLLAGACAAACAAFFALTVPA